MIRAYHLLMTAVTLAALFGAAAAAVAEVRYTVTDLGTFDGHRGSQAYAINDLGQVTGLAQGNVFLWENGVMTDLGFGTWGYDINDSAQIVGVLTGGGAKAFHWDAGLMTNLGTLGGFSAGAYGINNTGQVVGWAQNPDQDERAFLYENGVMSDLGTFGGDQSWAFGINSVGQVVGSAETDVTPPGHLPIRRAFLY
ncbi:MAG: hypothetical protein GY778_20295, partial [bacterium]|nr:hypothetical protein [bacterium]